MRKFTWRGTLAIALVMMSGGRAQAAADLSARLPGKFARLDDSKVHYLTAGNGSNAIVFVHGWAGNLGVWREQVPALESKARLILVDLPGHGRSDKPQLDYTLDYFARGVLAVMRDAGVPQATLVGHSMGVPVICRVVAQAPDKVAGLVSVDGFLRRPELAPEQAAKIVAPFRGPDYGTHVTNFISSMCKDPSKPAVCDQVLAEIMKTPQHVMASAMEKMFDASQPDWTLPKVTVPVLALKAPNPFWTAEYEAYVRALSSRTEYRVIPETHHWLMLQKPAAFNDALVSGLGKFGLIAAGKR